jgi:uncharacterized protein (DUF433 family)
MTLKDSRPVRPDDEPTPAAGLRYDRFVEETPGVGGGYPQVRGTRIPVRTIVAYYRAYGDVAPILRMFPYLTREQVQGALDYYAQSPGRVEEDRERNARALAELQGRRWPD